MLDHVLKHILLPCSSNILLPYKQSELQLAQKGSYPVLAQSNWLLHD